MVLLNLTGARRRGTVVKLPEMNPRTTAVFTLSLTGTLLIFFLVPELSQSETLEAALDENGDCN